MKRLSCISKARKGRVDSEQKNRIRTHSSHSTVLPQNNTSRNTIQDDNLADISLNDSNLPLNNSQTSNSGDAVPFPRVRTSIGSSDQMSVEGARERWFSDSTFNTLGTYQFVKKKNSILYTPFSPSKSPSPAPQKKRLSSTSPSPIAPPPAFSRSLSFTSPSELEGEGGVPLCNDSGSLLGVFPPSSCLICLGPSPDTVFSPCGHGGFCFECAQQILQKSDRCHYCREIVLKILVLDTARGQAGVFSVIAVYKIAYS